MLVLSETGFFVSKKLKNAVKMQKIAKIIWFWKMEVSNIYMIDSNISTKA